MPDKKDGFFAKYGSKKDSIVAHEPVVESFSAIESEPIQNVDRGEIEGSWERITLEHKDTRIKYVRLWASTDKMQAKICLIDPAAFAQTPSDMKNDEEKKALQEKQDKEYTEKLRELEGKLGELDENTKPPNEDAQQANLDKKSEEATVESKEAKEELPLELPVDGEFLYEVLNKAGIKKDAIIVSAVEQLVAPIYNKELLVAQGTYAINGEDAVIHEFFSRDNTPKFETRADGSIDFKNMHLVTNVTKNTLIAELIPPKAGESGFTVFGEKVLPRNGANLILLRGENTDIVPNPENPKVSNLIAKIDGNLVFKKDKFCIDNVYKVDGNVDNSVGNVSFVGNVIITGDVLEGYEIRTPGAITVFGMVEGASLYAGNSIHLEKGINGMSKGILEAGKEITAKFIENCHVRTGGDVSCESIINCKLECDGSVKVTGKGLISGGRLTVFGSVEAKVIGSRSSTPSTVVLGITPSILRERNEIDAQFKVVQAEYDEVRKNITYLEQQELHGEKSLNRDRMMSKLNGRLSIATLKKQRFEQRRAAIMEEMRNVATCTLTCDTVYPPARITIGNATIIVKEIHNNCRFYRNSDGEISIGMK